MFSFDKTKCETFLHQLKLVQYTKQLHVVSGLSSCLSSCGPCIFIILSFLSSSLPFLDSYCPRFIVFLFSSLICHGLHFHISSFLSPDSHILQFHIFLLLSLNSYSLHFLVFLFLSLDPYGLCFHIFPFICLRSYSLCFKVLLLSPCLSRP